MLYSKDRGFLLLEVPNTGTVALAKALKGTARQQRRLPRHFSANRARREFGIEAWQSLHTLAVVREPAKWLRSWYRYLNGIGRLDGTTSFQQLIEQTASGAVVSDVNGRPVTVGSQLERVSDGRGRKVIVSEILCFEYLTAEYNRVNSTLLGGKGNDLVPANVSPKVAANGDRNLDALIAEHWHRDYELWEATRRRAEQRYGDMVKCVNDGASGHNRKGETRGIAQ